jgi:hypothetical protein
MIRILILCFSLFPIISFSQNSTTLNKKELVGTWVIKEIKVNGVIKSDYDPTNKDVIILRENNTQTTTDKANDSEQSGPWRIVDNKHLELTDSEFNEKQLLEIVSLEPSVLKVRINDDDTIIEMTLNK